MKKQKDLSTYMEIDYEEVGKRIRRRRDVKKLKQKDVADAIDVAYGHYSNIENGKTKVSLDTLYKITQCLNCSLDDLVHNQNRQILIQNFDKKKLKKLENALFYLLALVEDEE